jgi:hypothetical protein
MAIIPVANLLQMEARQTEADRHPHTMGAMLNAACQAMEENVPLHHINNHTERFRTFEHCI